MMKKVFGMCLLAGLFFSCSEKEDLENPAVLKPCTVENLMNTPCKDMSYALSVRKTVDGMADKAGEIVGEEERKETYTFRLANGRLVCQVTDMIHACDFEKIHVEVSRKGKELTILIYPTYDLADCLCYADVSFEVKDIPAGVYRLKLVSAPFLALKDKQYIYYDRNVRFAEGEEVVIVMD